MQLAADLPAFVFLSRENLMGQMAQMFLEMSGLLQQLLVMSLAFLEGFFHRLALDDSLFQIPVGGGQVRRAPAQRLVQLTKADAGLERGAMSLLDRGDGLAKKNLRPLAHRFSGAGY